MNHFGTIEYKDEKQTGTITFNRPEVRNALNETMIEELHELFDKIKKSESVKAIIIQGNGNDFSAGADLNWMKTSINNTYAENYDGSRKLYELFEKLYNLPCLTISVVHGACIGGANGLLAASDIVFAEKKSRFSFSEVKLGLIPATIAPFIIKRMGEFSAKYYMLTGQSFNSKDALRIGLVNYAGETKEIENQLELVLNEVNNNSQKSVIQTKQLINTITKQPDYEGIKTKTIDLISKARISKEGQEGMKSFLEKRKPE
ncbi:MAG: enoyl-CoA hydratase-related protein [Bacteroidales bacterium]